MLGGNGVVSQSLKAGIPSGPLEGLIQELRETQLIPVLGAFVLASLCGSACVFVFLR